MKRLSLVGLGAIALFAAVPLVGGIPGVANIADMGSAIAQNIQKQPQVQLRLEAQKQVISQDQQGKQNKTWQSLESQATVQPADVLRYTISSENISDRPVKNLTINQPIPQGMQYVLKTAAVPENTETKISYSIDGGRNFVENPTIKVTLPDGKVEIKPAPATAYTHIRLNVPLVAAKATVKGTYQVQVR